MAQRKDSLARSKALATGPAVRVDGPLAQRTHWGVPQHLGRTRPGVWPLAGTCCGLHHCPLRPSEDDGERMCAEAL